MSKFNSKEFRKVLWTIIRYAVTAILGYLSGSCSTLNF